MTVGNELRQVPQAEQPQRPRVVVVGAGFGGLRAARGLADAKADVVVVDRVNHHLFQPLLYQVSTALLPPGDIAPPIRGILAGQENTRVVLGEVTDVDAAGRSITLTAADGTERHLPYDYLVVAAGATQSYFGHDEWREVAPPMKTLENALHLRAKLLRAFEIASLTPDRDTCREWMTFVVVGAGPTGVELAGQLAALARRTLRSQFHHLDAARLRIVLADAGDDVLAPFTADLRRHTRRKLERLGVEVSLGQAAVDIDERGITLAPAGSKQDDPKQDPRHHRIAARTVIWAAGVSPAPIAKKLAEATGAPTDRKGRLKVQDDCSLPGHGEIFAIGDMVDLHDLPGIAEPAIQEGRYVAKLIRNRLGEVKDPGPFTYLDLGTMATVAPLDAVAEIKALHLTGILGKVAWAGVHIAFLVGWGNRAGVLGSWAWNLTTGRRQQQVIVDSAGEIGASVLNSEDSVESDGSADPPNAVDTTRSRKPTHSQNPEGSMTARFTIFHEPGVGYFWTLDTGEMVLARSPMYETVQQAQQGIATTKVHAANAPIVHDPEARAAASAERSIT